MDATVIFIQRQCLKIWNGTDSPSTLIQAFDPTIIPFDSAGGSQSIEAEIVELGSAEDITDDIIILDYGEEGDLLSNPPQPNKRGNYASSNKQKKWDEDVVADAVFSVLKDIQVAMSGGSSDEDRLGSMSLQN